jgi:hypothetical protein
MDEEGGHDTSALSPMALRVTLTTLHNPMPHPLPSSLNHTIGKTQPENSPPSHQPCEAPSLNMKTNSNYT